VVVIPDSQCELMRLVAARVVPESAGLSPSEQTEMLTLVDQALADRPAAMQRQFRLFLRVLRFAPLVRYGRVLDRLAPPQQDSVLRWFQDCPVQILRSGFWGMRTLVMMGYYARPEVGASIGYHPSADGNAVLRDRSRR
jgi:hypothetical protein